MITRVECSIPPVEREKTLEGERQVWMEEKNESAPSPVKTVVKCWCDVDGLSLSDFFCREPKNWGRLLITLAVRLLNPVNITPEWWWIPPELRLLSCYCFKKVCTLQSEPTWVKCALHMSKGSRHCFIVFYIVACCVLFAWVCVVLHGFPCRRPVCVCTSCHCLMSVLPMTSLDFLITCTW